jgi:histidinol dehydrogenase
MENSNLLKVIEWSKLGEEQKRLLFARNMDADQVIQSRVETIIKDVQTDGDKALMCFSEQFDGVTLESLVLGADEIDEIAIKIDRVSQRSLEIAFQNIHKFHSVQNRRERKVETLPGVECWRENRPIEKVGLYVPGGTAVLPSTLLMLGVPARIAGCKEIVVCTPPQKDGKINPYVAYCLKLLQIERVFLIGGAQAIAAMAFGTTTVPKVDKIFGPGNQYVTKAKAYVQFLAQVAIDMPAGPSEVLIIADEQANPIYVAADLLAQAEHGPDSQAILVTTSLQLINEVNLELEKQLSDLPRAAIAIQALNQSFALHAKDLDEAMLFSNAYAPEHLILAIEDYHPLIRQIINAGSVFLGKYSAESFGDYASGTNHTLPTSGAARAYSGVSVDSFMKKITFQHINEDGLERLGPVVEVLAGIEGLAAHKRAISVRLGTEK